MPNSIQHSIKLEALTNSFEDALNSVFAVALAKDDFFSHFFAEIDRYLEDVRPSYTDCRLVDLAKENGCADFNTKDKRLIEVICRQLVNCVENTSDASAHLTSEKISHYSMISATALNTEMYQAIARQEKSYIIPQDSYASVDADALILDSACLLVGLDDSTPDMHGLNMRNAFNGINVDNPYYKIRLVNKDLVVTFSEVFFSMLSARVVISNQCQFIIEDEITAFFGDVISTLRQHAVAATLNATSQPHVYT